MIKIWSNQYHEKERKTYTLKIEIQFHAYMTVYLYNVIVFKQYKHIIHLWGIGK